MSNRLHRSVTRSLLLFAGFLLIGSALAPLYHFNFNPDGFSYVGIAQSYADLRWPDAINAYWSPLISMLLAPLLAAGIDAFLAFRAILLLSAACCWILSQRIFSKLNTDLAVQNLFTLVTLPLFLWWAFYIYTPDLLNLVLWLFLADRGLSGKLFTGTRNIMLTAATGFLLYLSKSYSFYFFPLVLLVFWYQYGRNTWKPALLVFFLYGLLCTVWIAALYHKYHEVTAGTAGRLNLALALVQGNEDQPIFFHGLYPPPHANAVFSWEDPSHHDYPELIFNTGLLKNLLLNFTKQSGNFFYLLLHEGFFLVLLIPTLLKKGMTATQKTLLFIALLYPLGYLVTFTHERYLWPSFVLLLICGMTAADRLLREKLADQRKRVLLLFVLCIPFISICMHRFIINTQKATPVIEYDHHLSALLTEPRMRTASDVGAFRYMLASSFLHQSRYYGMTKRTGTPEQVLEELKRSGIEVYASLTPLPILKDSGYTEHVMNAGGQDFYLYRISRR